MFIHEAIQAADPHRPFITRKAWMTGQVGEVSKRIHVVTFQGIWLFDAATENSRPEKWTPTRGDLTANDWIVLPPKHTSCARTDFVTRRLGKWIGLK